MWAFPVLAVCTVLVAPGLSAAVGRARRDAERHNCVCHFQLPDFLGGTRNGAFNGIAGYRSKIYASDPIFLEGRLDGQDARLNAIEHELNELTHKLQEKAKEGKELVHTYKNLELAVEHLEGHKCLDNQFQCHDEFHHCISNLLVCDGDTDCKDGSDEDSHFCRVIAGTGSVFNGEIDTINDHCTTRRPHHVRFIVTSAYVSPYFKVRPKMTVAMVVTFHTDDGEVSETLHSTGHWDYLHHRLVLGAFESDNLGLRCDFDGLHDDVCHAHIYNVASGEECVAFDMHRFHADGHEDHH